MQHYLSEFIRFFCCFFRVYIYLDELKPLINSRLYDTRQHYATSDSLRELSLPTYVLDDTGSDPHPKQIWTKALQDRFGNYIVQRVIETCSGAEKEEAGSEIAAPRARKLMDF